MFADVLDEDGAVKVPAGQGRGLDSSTHPANSKQQKEQGLYRDPPPADKKSAQQVLEAVPNKKPSMWDLPSMAELGAEVRQGVKAAKAPRKGAGSSRFSEAVDAAGQVTGPGTNVKEIFSDSRGTIRDVQSFAQTQGKLPSVYIAADDEPLPFPAMAATNLAEEEVDVAEMVSAGKVSLVGFGFRSSGDPMIKAFSMHWEKTFGADSRTQFLEVNMQASAAQRIGFIRRLMNRSMQSTVPPERHKLYLNHLVAEDSAAVEALQLNGTKLVGYATPPSKSLLLLPPFSQPPVYCSGDIDCVSAGMSGWLERMGTCDGWHKAFQRRTS